MFRFLLFIVVLAGAGLALTNPTVDDVRTKLDQQVASQTGGGGDQGASQLVTSLLTKKVQGQVSIERKNYFFLSIFKVSVAGGKPLPGCLIGIAYQAIPYDDC
jgi:hypothetical protein